MLFLANALFVINLIAVIIRDVSSEYNQENKTKLEEIRRQEDKFDYWDIDHNEASAIYYEPADSFTAKPYEFSKKFIISNPRTDGSPTFFVDKAYSSTTKEKRNSLRQDTNMSELCVNDTATDEGSNVLLDINLASSPSLRNSDSKELISELLAIGDIQTTKHKLEECIDLHLFKNKDVIENWQLLLSKNKTQTYLKFNEKEINKEIQEKCKHLEDVIDNNLAFLKHSTPKRNRNSSAGSTTTELSTITSKHLINEENIADSHVSTSHQTQNPFSDLSTDSSILTSHYKRGEDSDMLRKYSGLQEQFKPVINNTQTSKKASSELLLKTSNSSTVSLLNQSQTINENNPQRRSNTLNSQPKRHQVEHKMVYKESEINIPMIHTKELLNGSVITEANGTETLPNDDFKDFEIPKKEPFQTLEEKNTSTFLANSFNISETKVKNIDEKNATAAHADIKNASNYVTELSPPVNYSEPFSYRLAPAENVLAKDIKLRGENNFTDSSMNISTRNLDKWSKKNNTPYKVNTTSTITKQVNETTAYKDDIVNASQFKISPSTSKEISSSSLNGTLFFDFNGKLVPTHFIQNAEGSINIAIDGKSFCDNIVKNLQSIILQAICKSHYANSNFNAPETNKP